MKYITVFSARIARDLIKQGFIVRDIKPNREETARTVFYFEDTELVKNYLKEKHDYITK